MNTKKNRLPEAHRLAKKHNGECLSKTDPGCRNKLKWRCRHNHVWDARLDNVRDGTWCPICKDRLDDEQTENKRTNARNYYHENREKCIESARKWQNKNKKYCEEYRNRPENKERAKKYQVKYKNKRQPQILINRIAKLVEKLNDILNNQK